VDEKELAMGLAYYYNGFDPCLDRAA
jgi:hypothetical protein